MRILHTEWSDGLGGQEKRILAEAAGMSGRGHYVAILCREHSSIRVEAIKIGIDVHTLPLRRPYDIESIVKLIKLLKNEKYDIVNTHSGVDSWIGGIAAKLTSVPLLIRTRHLNIPLRRNLFNFVHYLPDVYITCGENMRENLVNQCGFPANKVVSIPTGVNPELFNIKKNKEAKLKYGLDMNSIVIANVGILRRVKGHEITLKAVKKVMESVPEAKFLIVGDGPRKDALEKIVNDIGINEYVTFTGYVNNIPEIYSFTDVAVFSSWSEGLPQGMLQAMAAGVPVIATKVGGVPEVVIDERTGILVEPGDYEALAGGIVRILSDPVLAMQIAENAKDYIMKQYSINHMCDKIEFLYKGLMSQ